MTVSSLDAAPTSARTALARLAATAATSTEGVASLTAGSPPVFATGVGPSRVVGVSVVAVDSDRYAVDLSIVATVTPLHALAQRLRETMFEQARRAGLAEALADVTVHIQDIS